MHARLSTYRYASVAADPSADPQRFVRLLAEQDGCLGVWELSDAAAGDEGEMESAYFSLCETEEQALSAGDRARAGVMALYDVEGITPTGPPQARVYRVVASAVDSRNTGQPISVRQAAGSSVSRGPTR